MPADHRPNPLTLDLLDDRLVPAVIDLTTAGVTADLPDVGAVVRQTAAQPTGTGHIQSFVRVQGAASGGGPEHGYNTTARPLQFDENSSPSFTRALKAADVPRRVVNGVAYREFLLDVNQKSSASKLSLDQVEVFLAGAPNLTGYGGGQLPGAAKVFDLDAQGDKTVLLDARLNSGSGAGDMYLLVPDAPFSGAAAGTYVYLYSRMGGAAGASANGGFEEWAVRTDGGEAPVGPGSLSGRVVLDLDLESTEDPISGLADVVIHLRGTDDAGNTVDLTAITDSNGSYSFTNLQPGNYSLWEEQPEQYNSVDSTAGSLGGIAGLDSIMSIRLDFGQIGTGYDFRETLAG